MYLFCTSFSHFFFFFPILSPHYFRFLKIVLPQTFPFVHFCALILKFLANSGFFAVSSDFKEGLRFFFVVLMIRMAFRLKQGTKVYACKRIKW